MATHRYVKAVNYSTKAPRRERPKMVLLADIAGDDSEQVAAAASQVVRLANARDAEGFVAVSPEARRRFWLDRARTAAISAHTNAFKINEDVVIPLQRLGDYSQGIERINIEQSIANKIEIADAVLAYLDGPLAEARLGADFEDSAEASAILEAKREAARDAMRRARGRWELILEQLDAPAESHAQLLSGDEKERIRPGDRLLDLLLITAVRTWFDGHQEMEQALVRFGRYVNDVEGDGSGDRYIELARTPRFSRNFAEAMRF